MHSFTQKHPHLLAMAEKLRKLSGSSGAYTAAYTSVHESTRPGKPKVRVPHSSFARFHVGGSQWDAHFHKPVPQCEFDAI